MQKSVALEAWRIANEDVEITTVDIASDGRFHVACLVTDNGDDTWHYEYAVQNLNSNRSAMSAAQ